MHKTRDQKRISLYVHLATDAHVGTASRLSARFRPLVARFLRFSFRFQRLTGATLHLSRKTVCGSLHPRLLPPTSYYRLTFNPSAAGLSVLHLLATVAVNEAGFLSTDLIKKEQKSTFHRQITMTVHLKMGSSDVLMS